MTRARLVVLLLAFLIAAPAFSQTNVTGDWDVTIQSPQGTNTVKVTFTQDGDQVKGLFKSQRGELPFAGTLTGDELTFAYTIDVQGMALDITMTGKVEGASIAGKAKFGDFGEGDWSAKRAVATDSAAAAAPAVATPPAETATPAAGGPTARASGDWEITIKTPGGDVAATATLADEDGKLTGTLRRDDGQMGEVSVSGTIDGKALKLSFTAQTPQGSLPITLTGDIEGDAVLNGKAEIGGMGTMEWTAKRKQ